MDRSREADIELLETKLFDMSIPYFVRCMAGRSLIKIRSDMKDRNITAMRQQLIKATANGDNTMIEQIGYRLKQYQRG